MDASTWIIEASIAIAITVIGALINRIYKTLDEIKSDGKRRSADLHARIDKMGDDVTGVKVCLARIDAYINGKR